MSIHFHVHTPIHTHTDTLTFTITLRSGLGMSIFNAKKNLTHLKDFAEVCGISSQTLTKHLNAIMTSEAEVKRVVE